MFEYKEENQKKKINIKLILIPILVLILLGAITYISINLYIDNHYSELYCNTEMCYKITSDNETLYDLGTGSQKGTVVNRIFQDSEKNIWFALDNGITIINDIDSQARTRDRSSLDHGPETVAGEIHHAGDQYSVIDSLLLLPVYTVEILDKQYREYYHAHDICFNVEKCIARIHIGILA